MTNIKRTSKRLGERLGAITQIGLLGRQDGALRGPRGMYYVREILADGREMPAITLPRSRDAQFPVRYNIAVRLGRNSTGQRVIMGSDQAAMLVQGVNPAVTNMGDPQNLTVHKEQITPLRCRPSQDPAKPLYAEVLPERFVLGSTYYDWVGGDIDVSGEVPASGNHCYTIVFWRTSTNGLSIASSTPQSTGTALDSTDVQEAIDAADTDAMPIKAFVLQGDMTALNGDVDHTIDIRTLFSTGVGSGGATDFSDLTGTAATTQGGTGITSYATGDILYASASNVLSKLAIGTNGFFLKVVAGIPAWAALAASDIASGILALARGGTGADLSATGPGFLKQASLGANVSVAALSSGDIPDISGTYVPKSLYDANTILKADSDNTPVALTMDASTILARLAAGNIVAATAAQIRTLLGMRETLAANRTYYVRTDGSDSNDGLTNTSGGAFLTIQHALDVVQDTVDLAGYDVTIQIGNGTYTQALTVTGPWTGAGTVTLLGDTTTPTNVLFSITGGVAITLTGAKLSISGIGIATTGTNAYGILGQDYSSLTITGKCDFGACGGRQMFFVRYSVITVNANYTISGGAPHHVHLNQNAVMLCAGRTITLTGTPAFSTVYIYHGLCSTSNNTGTTFSGSATGTRYLVDTNSVIDGTAASATFFPGNAAGSTATGGVYR